MNNTTTQPTPSHRITVIDALRGFALLGVIVTHSLQHFGIYTPSSLSSEAPLFPGTDKAIEWLLQNIIMGKFINIFAFLFGMSFFIQMDNARKKGVAFRKRFLWRMAVLFIIGVIGNCFYTGDILSIYALFGVLLLLLYPLKSKFLLLIASVLLLGTPRILTVAYNRSVKTEQTATSGTSSSVRQQPATETPSFFNSAKHNLTNGLQGKLNYQFGLFGRGYLTFALFIFGFIVGRLRFFETVHLRTERNDKLLGCFVLATIAVQLSLELLPSLTVRTILTRLSSGNAQGSFFLILALNDLSSVLVSGVLAMGFIVLYQTKRIGIYLNRITPYGRMGLTNYEMQGVVGSILFSAWGLGLGSIFGSWDTTAVFALGLLIYAAQVTISWWWLKYYRYGPLEWFWRSATYFKRQPFRK